ncbi:hypothetical protein ACIO8H_16065 [Streptomyces sp. NPDC087226]|uniref:hypothetical protein n=1 Tax=Streptomyces sp. NPDC087226 TaxID=3365771 RepID=UPI0038257EF4
MADRELKDGEEVLLRGGAGALFRVTVGQPFTRDLIERRLESGEWSWPGSEPKPAEQGEPEPRTEEKSKPAPGEDSPKPRTELKSERGDADEPGPHPREEIVSGAVDDDPDRPAQSAPKADWVVYVARKQHMSREDAANYTKADLIDMVS